MTIRARNRILVAGLLIGIAAAAATLLPMLASSGSDDVREIRLVVEHLCDTEETFLNRTERERLDPAR